MLNKIILGEFMIVAEILNTVRGSFSIYIVSLNHVSSSLSHKRRISVLNKKYTKIYNEDQQLMLRMQRFNGNNYFTGYSQHCFIPITKFYHRRKYYTLNYFKHKFQYQLIRVQVVVLVRVGYFNRESKKYFTLFKQVCLEHCNAVGNNENFS